MQWFCINLLNRWNKCYTTTTYILKPKLRSKTDIDLVNTQISISTLSIAISTFNWDINTPWEGKALNNWCQFSKYYCLHGTVLFCAGEILLCSNLIMFSKFQPANIQAACLVKLCLSYFLKLVNQMFLCLLTFNNKIKLHHFSVKLNITIFMAIWWGEEPEKLALSTFAGS